MTRVPRVRAFGERLKAFREARGLSKADLAAAAEISRSYVTKLEQGTEGNPSGAVLGRLARALHVSLDQLVENYPGAHQPASLLDVEHLLEQALVGLRDGRLSENLVHAALMRELRQDAELAAVLGEQEHEPSLDELLTIIKVTLKGGTAMRNARNRAAHGRLRVAEPRGEYS
jgi:transcriptional regulator with XRE-family HTH domain